MDDPQVIELATQPSVAVRLQQPMAELDLAAAFDRYLPIVGRRLTAAGGTPAGPPYGRYHRFGPDIVDVEIGVPVANVLDGIEALDSVPPGEVGASELPAGPAARTVHRGTYDGLSATYDRLLAWIRAQSGWDEANGPWESYVDMPPGDGDFSRVRTDVIWPLAPRREPASTAMVD